MSPAPLAADPLAAGPRSATGSVPDRGDLPRPDTDQRHTDQRHADERHAAVAVFAGGVATFASLYSTQALLPLLGSGFGVGAGAAASSVSAATVGMATGLLVSGTLSDRLGRTPLMRWALLVTAVLDLLAAFAPTWPVLLALRGAQGLALSCFPAAAVAYLREEVPASRHARVSGLYIGGTAIGGMSGRLVAALGAQWGGWRAGLGAVAVLAAGCALVCWVLLPASRGFRAVPSAARRSSLRVAARLARDPVLAGLWILGGLVMGVFVATFNTIGYRLQGGPYHVSVAAVGFVFLVYAFGSLASGWAGRMAGRRGRPPVVLVGALILLAGVGVTASRPLPWIVVGLVVVTCGFFVVHGVASGWVAARAQTHSETGQASVTGQASAIYLVVYYVGSSLAGIASGHAWAEGAWRGVALLTAVLALLAVLLAALLTRDATPAEEGAAGALGDPHA